MCLMPLSCRTSHVRCSGRNSQAYATWREQHERIAIGRRITYRMLHRVQASAFDAWREHLAYRRQLRASAADVMMGGRLRCLRHCLQQWREWSTDQRNKKNASVK